MLRSNISLHTKANPEAGKRDYDDRPFLATAPSGK